MRYSIDTDAIINLLRRRYPPTIFPSLLKACEGLIASGELRAISLVHDQLARQADDVYEWAEGQSDLFVPLDERVQAAATAILADHEGLVDPTATDPVDADPFVIALAQVGNAAVITSEGWSNSSVKPHIPDVCDALGIPCMDLLKFFEAESWEF